MNNKSIEDKVIKKFNKKFPQVGYWKEGYVYDPQSRVYGPTSEFIFAQLEIEGFLKKAIQSAIKEAVEECIEIIEENQKGTFTDDAGHDCWYIDSLVKRLREYIKKIK